MDKELISLFCNEYNNTPSSEIVNKILDKAQHLLKENQNGTKKK